MLFFYQVHFELAKYNEMGRFTENDPDLESALYHLEKSAHCGYREAMKLIALIYLQLPHDVLEEIVVEVRVILIINCLALMYSIFCS